MAGLFRSEDMQYVRLLMTADAASDTIYSLGLFGKFHVVDLTENDLVQTDSFLYYKKRIMHCSNFERKLSKLEQEMHTFNVEVPSRLVEIREQKGDILVGVQQFIEPIEADLSRDVEFRDRETHDLNALIERGVVLDVCKNKLMNANGAEREVELSAFESPKQALNNNVYDYHEVEMKGKDSELEKNRFHNYICGTIPITQQALFERMIFRISRGNAYVKFEDIPHPVADPATGETMTKAAFYIVYIGQALAKRLEKICDFLKANRYEVPTANDVYRNEVRDVENSIADKRHVIQQTNLSITRTLQRLSYDQQNKLTSPLRDWQEALRKEKLVCDVFRKCRFSNNASMITCEGWCPVEDLNALDNQLYQAVAASGAQPAVAQRLQINTSPPTYFKIDKVSGTFQAIVNTYGVPRYKEVNPGLFTIVTFPFLFGVMYGDIGHGFFLFLASLVMIYYEKPLEARAKAKQLPEMFAMAFGGRYLLVSMGFFAFYCGWIYNDCFSVPINLFGTNWEYLKNIPGDIAVPKEVGKVYPFGIDPYWHHSDNELTFFNSVKMKLSVTLGVIQMLFGISLGLFNHLYFGDYISIFFEFIPQMIFMTCTFGYMIFLIIYKFTVDWASHPDRSPPNLIQTMIGMFLSIGHVDAKDQLYPNQGPVQLILLLLAVLSIPWMLFGKPYVHKWMHNRDKDKHQPLPQHDDDHADHGHDAEHGQGHGHGAHEEFNFSEHFIHQCIHTIEFVLGAVSNTASYLRLWALSLAHAELADVFWKKLIMEYGIQNGNPFMAFVGWAAWAGATFAVLMCMDVLECFLHALRLHWVEFQNKFFHADGYAFLPFTFEEKDDD